MWVACVDGMHGLHAWIAVHVRVVVACLGCGPHLPVTVVRQIGPHNNQEGQTKGEDLMRI